MSLNKVMLIGNLGKDPEGRVTQGGLQVATFSLATNERRKNGDQWEDHVEWHNIVCFGKTAEAVLKFCQKGKQVYVDGKITTEKWQDKEGKDRYTTKIIAETVRFLGGGSGEGGGQRSSDRDGYGNGGHNHQNRQPYQGDEDIPF